MIASNKRIHAFSLIELSIVLVILGLLTGGILAGKSLIRAAELRAVTSDYHRHVTSAQTFRDKYFMLPGDINNATQFWGVAGGNGTGNDAACRVVPSSDMKTCNGNGDKFVATSTGSMEQFRFWQHLANAGIIEGQYTGVYGTVSGIDYYSPGRNVPVSKVASKVFFLPAASAAPTYGHVSYFDGTTLGNSFSVLTNAPTAPAAITSSLRPEEAWNIDTKMDDGGPASGKVGVRWGGDNVTGLPCTTAASSADVTATYYLQESSITCIINFYRAI
jgi:prepilin-type N-terminal cleavage/methylation domain-containing protein